MFVLKLSGIIQTLLCVLTNMMFSLMNLSMCTLYSGITRRLRDSLKAIYLSIFLSIYLSIFLSIFLSIYLSIYLYSVFRYHQKAERLIESLYSQYAEFQEIGNDTQVDR